VIGLLIISIRAVSLILKLLAIVLIANSLPVTLLDLYFLVATVTAVISQLFGLQTYQIVLRNFNVNNDPRFLSLLGHQHFLIGACLCSGLVLLGGLINSSFGVFSLLFVGMLIAEIFALELGRFFIILARPKLGVLINLSISITYIFIALYFYIVPQSDFNILMVSPFLVFIIVWVGFCKIKGLISLSFDFSFSNNIKLLSDASGYFFSQLANISMLYLNRFIIELQDVNGLLSSFSLLQTIGNTIPVLVTAGFIGPYAASYMQSKVSLKKIVCMVCVSSALLSITLIGFYDFIAVIVRDGLIAEYRSMFIILVIGAVAFSVAQVFQLFLSRNKKHHINFISYMAALTVSVPLAFTLIPSFGLWGACIASTVPYLILLGVRFVMTVIYLRATV